jgi:hypothetical protein
MVKYIANKAAKNISSEDSQTMVPTLTRLGLLAGVRGAVSTVAVATKQLLRQPVGDRYATPRICELLIEMLAPSGSPSGRRPLAWADGNPPSAHAR